MVTNSGKAKTPELVFLAMLSLLAVQVMPVHALNIQINSEKAYWTYFPNPPLLHASSWSRSNVKIFTSHPELMGGISDSFIPHKMTNSQFSWINGGNTFMFFSGLYTFAIGMSSPQL